MQPLFLPAASGTAARFAVLHRPAGPLRGLVVYAHPFAEEMNKSRRMAAIQARALASRGFGVLIPDLLGCGDSGGDFGDASWTAWVDDIVHASQWLRGEAATWPDSVSGGVRGPPLSLWGLRAGALLAAEAAARLGDVQQLVVWQPATSGKVVLQQFLRLQLAGELLGGQTRGGTDALKARLAAGQSVDLAGYRIAPELAQGLEGARLQPVPSVRRLHWLELSQRDDATLSPASATSVQAWQQAGAMVNALVVPGPTFWQTTEIEDAPALVAATLAALEQPAHAAPPVPVPA